MDFAVLPPEVNSGRMYAGAGSGPLEAAAAAWDGLASELSSAAHSYQAVISGLTAGPWLGPSSTAMAAAAAPYLAWMNTTAAQAEQTASQARSAAAAYQAAFAATVPPSVIAANRMLLASLVATNILGQNTPAITATEAQYAEMWAQDATAMYGYDGASASATTLTAFTEPQQNTNPAATGTQAAAAATQATATSTSQTTSTGSSWLSDLITELENLVGSPTGEVINGLTASMGDQLLPVGAGTLATSSGLLMMSPLFDLATAAGSPVPVGAVAPAGAVVPGALAAGLADSRGAGMGGRAVTASLGRAASVGGLSAPQSWGTAAPEIRLAAQASPLLAELPGVAGVGGSYGGMPLVGPIGSVINAPRSGEPRPRNGHRLKVIPRTDGDPGVDDSTMSRGVQPARDADGQLTAREELVELRKAIALLAKERDVLKRSASLLIKEAMQR